MIGDLIWTYQKLPFHLQAKGEFEYVGRKVVGNGCNESNPDDLNSYCLGVPNKEFRLALARPFLEGKINVGVNMMIARGYTGQTIGELRHGLSSRVMWALCRFPTTRLRRWSECAFLPTRA